MRKIHMQSSRRLATSGRDHMGTGGGGGGEGLWATEPTPPPPSYEVLWKLYLPVFFIDTFNNSLKC